MERRISSGCKSVPTISMGAEFCLLSCRSGYKRLNQQLSKPHPTFRHLQYVCQPCMESLGRRLLLSMCLYCFQKIGKIDCVRVEGLAWLLSPLYSNSLGQGFRLCKSSQWLTCLEKAFTHGQLKDTSPGWGQRFTWHPTSPTPLVNIVVVSC